MHVLEKTHTFCDFRSYNLINKQSDLLRKHDQTYVFAEKVVPKTGNPKSLFSRETLTKWVFVGYEKVSQWQEKSCTSPPNPSHLLPFILTKWIGSPPSSLESYTLYSKYARLTIPTLYSMISEILRQAKANSG